MKFDRDNLPHPKFRSRSAEAEVRKHPKLPWDDEAIEKAGSRLRNWLANQDKKGTGNA